MCPADYAQGELRRDVPRKDPRRVTPKNFVSHVTSRKDLAMSLTVPADLLDQARQGDVDDDAFTACIQASLPYAWELIGD
jgi:hypothetical protein